VIFFLSIRQQLVDYMDTLPSALEEAEVCVVHFTYDADKMDADNMLVGC
jgi:hypothetical protein